MSDRSTVTQVPPPVDRWAGLLAVATFVALVALTGSSWWTHDHAGKPDIVAAVAFALAVVKIVLIGTVFMDIRRAPPLVVGAFVLWCAVTLTVVLLLLLR